MICFSIFLATLVPLVGLTPASVPESLVQEVVELVVVRMERKAQLEPPVRLELVEEVEDVPQIVFCRCNCQVVDVMTAKTAGQAPV